MDSPESNKSYFQNWVSVIGGIGSLVVFALIVFLVALEYWAKDVNPYLGIITYLVAPVFLAIFLVLIPVGALQERSRRKRHLASRRFPQIDFNNPKHQQWAYTAIGIGTLFFLCSVYGTYRAYEYTESVKFCGLVCHDVMEPEYTAYHHSPHARVACVQCHIGNGAEYYLRSKIRGSYQMYSVLAKKYSRPIKTPIHNLRPAQETCEQCHWPQQFFGAVEQDHQYFLSDENNTPWKTRMLMFVGGGIPPYGKKEGIHWHMNINSKVYYVATDEKRQEIPWVKRIGPDGKEEVFVQEGTKYSAALPPKGEMRLMDCMDCHNRPSHNFKSPEETVNEAMAYGAIDRTLPFIKKEAVKSLVGKYENRQEAEKGIRASLEGYYQKKYPQVWEQNRDSLNRSIETVQHIYRDNFFPEMKVSWKEYPDNIGHLMFPGCFRCHDGKHKSAEGRVISNECNICHNIVSQGKPEAMESGVDGLPFHHPDEDTADAWKDMKCMDCHTGGAM